MRRKVIILSQVFPPDPAAVGQYFEEAGRELVKADCDVTVITANRGYDDPEKQFAAFENRGGLNVRRLPLSSFGKGSMFIRIFGQLSFLCQCMFRTIFCRNLTDLLISTSPPMGGIVAVMVGFLRPNLRVHYWVMDLNPDQAVALGVFDKNHFLVCCMNWLNRRILKRSRSVIALDRFMKDRLLAKFANSEVSDIEKKISVIPPWPMGQHVKPVSHEENWFRQQQGWKDKFVVMFSGNHSWVHPLGTILDAAEALELDDRFVFVFIGGGKGKAVVDSRIANFASRKAKEKPAPEVISMPYQSLDDIPFTLSAADLHIVSLGDQMSGIVHPCKVYGALAMGRPILALGPSESYLRDLMEIGGVGWAVSHGDVEGAKKALLEAADREMGKSSESFSRSIGLIQKKFDRNELKRDFLNCVLSG